MVGDAGLEPATSPSRTAHSTTWANLRFFVFLANVTNLFIKVTSYSSKLYLVVYHFLAQEFYLSPPKKTYNHH